MTKNGEATPSQTITYRYNDAGQLLEVTQTGDTTSHHAYTLDEMGRTTLEKVTYGKDTTAITKQLEYGYDKESRLASFKYPEGSLVNYQYDKTLLKQAALANGQSIEWAKYQWFSPTEINFPNAKQVRTYDALQRPLSINVANTNNPSNTLINRAYQYNPAGNIIERATEKGNVNYRYDLLDRLTEAKPEKALQDIGLPDEAYTYDAIGNRLGSRHQPGQFEYNQQDQLVKWGANAQLEALSYTPTGQVKQKKKLTETIDYSYDATDRLSQIKRDDTEIASYQYDPFGRRFSKRVNGELTYYLYSDEGLIAELNEQGKIDVAYGWEPNSLWGTSPLWQANLKAGQTLKNADYHYLHTDHIGTPQIATNQVGEITWQAQAEAFGETQLNPTNQITMNLRFPGQYYDAETGTHYNYFRDYNPQTGRYQQSDPFGLKGYWACVAESGATGAYYGTIAGGVVGTAGGAYIGAAAGAGAGGVGCTFVVPGFGTVACGAVGAVAGAGAGGAAGAWAGGKAGFGTGGILGGVGGLFTCFSNDDGDCPDKENITKQTSTGGAAGNPYDPDDKHKNKQKKVKRSKISGKEGAKNPPDWVKQSGEIPSAGESGKSYAKRMMDGKYGPNNYDKGGGSEYNQTQKWADRAFQDPPGFKR